MAQRNFFIIWVDGLGKGRELIQSITDDKTAYTHHLTKAMRIKDTDIEKMKVWMREHEFADWCIESPSTFIATSYAPKGTLFKF